MEISDAVRTLVHVRYLPDEEIENAANRLRADYAQAGGPTGSMLNPENLIWDYLYERDRLSLDTETLLGVTKDGERIAGKMSVLPDGGLIRIDSGIVGTPLFPFTLGHEIGHWTLHRSCILEAICQGSLFDNAPREWTTLHRNLRPEGGHTVPREEYQANRFATHLLMPDRLVRDEYKKRFGDEPADYRVAAERSVRFTATYPTLRDFAMNVASLTETSELPSLASHFGVSKTAMAIRLQELRLVTDDPHTSSLDL